MCKRDCRSSLCRQDRTILFRKLCLDSIWGHQSSEEYQQAIFNWQVGSPTCSSSQHTGPVSHFGPQRSTICSLRASVGSVAGPLSGQGNCAPKKPFFPQVPRIEHRPASWIGVYGSQTAMLAQSAARAVLSFRMLLMCSCAHSDVNGTWWS